MGLENIGKHIVGDAKWEKLYDGGSSTEEQAPQDFEPEKTPPPPEQQSCGRSRKGSTPTRANYQAGQDEENFDDEEEDEEVEEADKNDESRIETPESPPEQVSKEEEKLEETVEEQLKSPQGSVEEEGENENIMEEGGKDGEREEMEEKEMEQGSGSTPNSPQHGGVPADTEPMDSPAPSDGVGGEEKGGEGGALVDNLFQILPYWYFLNRAFGLPGEQDGAGPGGNALPTPQSDEMDQNDEDIDGDEDEGGSSEGGHRSSPQSASRLNSLLLLESLRQQLQSQGTQMVVPNENVLQQGIQLSEILSKMSGGAPGSSQSNSSAANWRAAQHSPSSTAIEAELEDQPLDLTSSRKRDDTGNKLGFRRADEYSGPVVGDTPDVQSPFLMDEQTSKVFRSNPRSSKGYTAQELQAALHDIQSGKLGTRRAAVIYGIPRSTLRNKVYKLGKDRGRLFPNQNGPHHNNNNNSVNHNNNIQAKEAGPSGGLLGKLSYLQGLNASSYLQHQTRTASRFMGSDDGEEERRPAFIREPPTLYPVNNGGREDDKPGPPKLIRGKSSLSELISKHHAQAQRTQQIHHPSYQNQIGMDMEETSPSGDSNEPLTLLSHADWKSHLLNQHHHHQQQQRDGQSSSSNQRHHHQHHPPSHLLHQQTSDDASNSLDLAGKKSRPKRGKYRNYDREALVKAVRAVQNGEMSVHRAGSFFGVPHSTLEYKVKERHLLRRPKRKEVTSPLSQTKSSPENSSDAAPSSRSFPQSSSSTPSFYSKKGISSSSTPFFPLTSDLRESLSRYLKSEQHDNRSDSQPEMDVGPSPSSQDETRSSAPSSRKEEGPFALEGLIGSRLSSLFQLNDMLIRSSSGGSETLDLSKK